MNTDQLQPESVEKKTFPEEGAIFCFDYVAVMKFVSIDSEYNDHVEIPLQVEVDMYTKCSTWKNLKFLRKKNES